jgi:hypothetical protein
VWLRAIKYRMGQEDVEGSKHALDRALHMLPKSEHINLIRQAALLEFRSGDPGVWGACAGAS